MKNGARKEVASGDKSYVLIQVHQKILGRKNFTISPFIDIQHCDNAGLCFESSCIGQMEKQDNHILMNFNQT